ncbi:MAG: nucleoside hydrolase [Clostridia bacterium]|nr:nucleoside hydrolase [Clostridia bacterium]
MIVDTDCKNEADDQFALAHHLMTPMFDVKAIIAAHFEMANRRTGGPETTMMASYDEVNLMLDLMELTGEYPVLKGCVRALPDEHTPVDSEGARFIIEEAKKDDPRPLFIGVQGSITNVASAILMAPEISEKLHVIWIGGGDYPEGGWEFNLKQDLHAANVVFSSRCELWQVPKSTYKLLNISLSELQYRVAPCGKVGEYLFRQMVELNDKMGENEWPHGETWCIGDQPTIGLLLEDKQRTDNYTMKPAPRVAPDCTYMPNPGAREIRVYHNTDVRLTLEDFYAKLALHYGE